MVIMEPSSCGDPRKTLACRQSNGRNKPIHQTPKPKVLGLLTFSLGEGRSWDPPLRFRSPLPPALALWSQKRRGCRLGWDVVTAAARESLMLLSVSRETQSFTKVDLTDSFFVLSPPSLFEVNRCLSLPREVTQPQGSVILCTLLSMSQGHSGMSWALKPNKPLPQKRVLLGRQHMCYSRVLSVAVTDDKTKSHSGEERIYLAKVFRSQSFPEGSQGRDLKQKS